MFQGLDFLMLVLKLLRIPRYPRRHLRSPCGYRIGSAGGVRFVADSVSLGDGMFAQQISDRYHQLIRASSGLVMVSQKPAVMARAVNFRQVSRIGAIYRELPSCQG